MNNPAPNWIKYVSIAFLLWNLIGIAAFVSQWHVAHNALETLPPEQQVMWRAMPGWAWLAYGVAVLGGTAGATGLVMRKGWAVPAYLAGLLAVLIQFFNSFFVSDGIATLGKGAVVFPLVIIILAAVQLWLSRNWRAAGWLR